MTFYSLKPTKFIKKSRNFHSNPLYDVAGSDRKFKKYGMDCKK